MIQSPWTMMTTFFQVLSIHVNIILQLHALYTIDPFPPSKHITSPQYK